MADILDELAWRGLVAQSTDIEALRATLAEGPVSVYCGFDPTAASLHVGNLVPLLALRRFQLAGHRPIGVVGGATGLIGDPSGRSSERALNETEIVESWVARIRGQVERFLDFSAGPTGALLVNNLDWTAKLSAVEFLRDVGKRFSVNAMLAKDSVSGRLAAGGISYTEFSYQVLQAQDYLELYRRHGCRLQIGGSDQWGNITAGLDLIRKSTGGTAHALTVPLVTRADGAKFGKTAAGAIWIDPELTSPYAFYQFWVNTDDQDVASLLRRFSFRAPQEIEELEKQTRDRPAARLAQRALAEELTTLVHGERECASVVAASRALFGQGELAELDAQTLAAALAELPRVTVRGPLPATVDLLADSGLVASRSAARRAIEEGGAYVNNTRVGAPTHVPAATDLLHGRWLLLRRGRRNLAAVEVDQNAAGSRGDGPLDAAQA